MEIYEVNGKRYNVSPERKQEFLNEFPNAMLVRELGGGYGTTTSTISDSSGLADPYSEMMTYGMLQQPYHGAEIDHQIGLHYGQLNTIKAQEDMVMEERERIEWTGVDWVDNTLNTLYNIDQGIRAGWQGAAASGESFDLLLQGSDVTQDKVDAFVEANIDQALNYKMSPGMKNFQDTYKKNGSDIYAFFQGLKENPGLLAEVMLSSLAGQVRAFFEEEGGIAKTTIASAFGGGTLGWAKGGKNKAIRYAIAGGMGGLGSSGQSSRVRTLGRPQPRVQSPMEAGMGPGAAKARAMAKARNKAKQSGTAAPSMSGADRAKSLAKARIAKKKKSKSSGGGFGGSTSSSSTRSGINRSQSRRRSSGGSRSRGSTGSSSSKSSSSSRSRSNNTSRSRRGGTSSSRSRGGVSRGSRRRGGRRGRRGGRRCDLRCKINIMPLTNMHLQRDELAQVAYFVTEIKSK